MADTFITNEFLGLDKSSRAKQCRQMADEAGALAAAASNAELRSAYLDLKKQWNVLADEIAHSEQSDNSNGPPATRQMLGM